MTNAQKLKPFSTDELLAEIVRRRSFHSRPISKWCDDCSHFIAWTGDIDPPEDFNPCDLKHGMSFRVGDGYSNHDCGHYRVGCPDYDA